MIRDPIKDFYRIQERERKDIRSLRVAMFVPNFIAIGSLFLAFHFGFGIVLGKRNAFSGSYIIGLIGLAALYSYILARFQYSVAKRNGAPFILKRFSVRSPDLKKSADRLFLEIADNMQKTAGLAKINIFIIPSRAANALALVEPEGTPCLALTEGYLREFKRDEIEPVIAREIAMIVRGDALYRTLVCSLADFLERIQYSFDIKKRNEGPSSFSPSRAIRRYLSRYIKHERDTLADAAAVELGRNPVALAQALAGAFAQNSAVDDLNHAYSPLFLVPPESAGKKEDEAGWLQTAHPPLLTRIRRLAILAGQKSEDILQAEVLELLKKAKSLLPDRLA